MVITFLIGLVAGMVIAFLLLILGGRRPLPPVSLPFPNVSGPEPKPVMADTLTIFLYETLHSKEANHEIALHTNLLPQTYSYAGSTYRRWRRLRDRSYAFVRVS